VAEEIEEGLALTASQLWCLVMPEFFGEVELDLAHENLIPDLDAALTTQTWQFVRAAILRLLDIDSTWLRKAVERERRRNRLRDPDEGRRGVQEGLR
jgi:hypothetical protein